MPIIRLDPDSSLGKALQSLQTIYYGLIAVPLVLFLLLYLEAGEQGFAPLLGAESSSDNTLWLHIFIWVAGIVVAAWGYNRYNKRLKANADTLSLEQKFMHYVKESKGFYVLLALVMLMPVLAIWLTGKLFYGILFMLLIILIAAVRPTALQFVQKFRLSKEQQEELLRIS